MKVRRVCVALGVLVLLAVGAGAFLKWKGEADAKSREEQYARMRSDAEYYRDSGMEAIPVDFAKWQEKNPEIYAWITIPGTDIDEPVVQSRAENSFYLNHSAEGQKNTGGAVFSEDYNALDFSDVHTVLYGQSLEAGNVFADLHQYGDETFFQEHPLVAVFTADAVRYYRVFAAYLYDNRHLLQSFDCTKPRVFQSYVEKILEQRNLYSQIDHEAKIGQGDRILTLSTGHSRGTEYRFLVQAVLQEEIPVPGKTA